MGKIIYGPMRQEIDLDDRAMAHLQAVVASKLRRNEGFFLNWKDDPSVGDGHTAVWVGPNIPILFKYYGGKQVELSRAWLEQMTLGANSNGGLHLGDDPTLTTPVPTSS